MVYDNIDASITLGCHTLSCACAPLPEIHLGDLGRFVSMTQSGNNLFASAYDATYGDLVIMTYNAQTLEQTALRYADGFPNSGKITGNPTGRRGGRLDKGRNVGTHTAIAMRNGRPIVVYVDEESQSLKIAFLEIDGKITTGVIHQATKSAGENIGRFSSIVVDEAGVIHVAYFADNITIDAQRVSTPMYARAKISLPKTPEDWDHLAIEPMRHCDDKGCLQETADPACKHKDPSSFQLASLNFTENSRGNGLYTAIAIHNDKPMVVYQDSAHGYVRGATANFTRTDPTPTDFTTTKIDCGVGSIDVGNYTALRIAPNNDVVVAYGDGLGNTIHTYRGEDFARGTTTRIDDGLRASHDIRVGGPISILFDSHGTASFIYGDLSNNDVIITTPSENGFVHHTIIANGAFGSAQSAVVISDDQALILAHRRSFKQATPGDLVLRTLDLRAF